MSINAMMKTYEVWENKQLIDQYGNPTNEEQQVGTTSVTINQATASSFLNEVKYAEVTHFGLTRDKTHKQGQVLIADQKRYVIELPPNHTTRYTQLFLKEVVTSEW